MKTRSKRLISAGVAVLAMCAVAAPAAASQNSYNFNAQTPAFQLPAAVGRDAKTVTGHYGTIYFSSIKTGYKATAELCNYTALGVYCGASTEQTNLGTGVTYRIPSASAAGADTFFRIRTNTITTEQISMLGRSVTW
jgi:hypothetical protein